jgi:hypothetical protein
MPTTAPDDDRVNSRWRFSRTISLDSVIVLIVTVVSGLVFVLTLSAKVDQQGMEVKSVTKLVERIEADQKERINRIERDQQQRADRLEAQIKEQTTLVQRLILEPIRR